MEHSQERKASEEMLRLVIQKMAAQPAAFTPPTYTVWYEHLTGTNPRLDQAIREAQQQNQAFDDSTMERLYREFVSDAGWGGGMREGMQQVLGRVLHAAVQSDQQAVSFGSSLQQFGQQLRAKPESAALEALTTQMAQAAEAMHGSVSQLHQEMSACKGEIERLQNELHSARQEALIDPLTGVYNRRGFERQAQQLLNGESKREEGACLLMIDIDHFKHINDSYGHLFGDKVLRTFAGIFKALVKGQDSVCRMGGEEFAILLPQTQLQGAAQLAEHIRNNIEHGRIKSPVSDVQIDNITISIGVATLRSGHTLLQWIDLADKALYQSKRSGRNRVTVQPA